MCRIAFAMWISVDDTPRGVDSPFSDHRCRFGLNHVRFRFSIGGMRCNFFITGPSGPIAVVPGGRDARVTCSPKIGRSQRPGAAADSRSANRSAENGLAATVLYAAERRGRANVGTMGRSLPWRAVSWVRRWNRRPHTDENPLKQQLEPAPLNVVVVGSAVAGVGASTLAALLARELTERGCKSVLVDADLNGGGLDVLLGVEDEDGSRWSISAPLGKVDGKALPETARWDGVPLLACNPWRSENPQSWEIRRTSARSRRWKDAR